jgi:hypothetical protein
MPFRPSALTSHQLEYRFLHAPRQPGVYLIQISAKQYQDKTVASQEAAPPVEWKHEPVADRRPINGFACAMRRI